MTTFSMDERQVQYEGALVSLDGKWVQLEWELTVVDEKEVH